MKKVKFYPVLNSNEKMMVEAIAKGFKLDMPYEFDEFQNIANCLKAAAEKAITTMNVSAVKQYISTLTAFNALFTRIKEERTKFDANFDKECADLRKLMQSL